MPTHRPITILVAAVVLLACDSEQAKTTAAPLASALATSKSDSEKAEPWTVASESKADFVMPGKLETIKGTVERAEGKLEIDLSDLTQTRGEIRMDMTALKTHTFGDKDKDGTQTEHARTWLEVSENVEDAAVRAKHQWAVFAIRSVVSADPSNLATQTGAERSSKIEAKGELLVHGHKSEHTIQLTATFNFDGARATKLALATDQPLLLDLEAHEIRPRDNQRHQLVPMGGENRAAGQGVGAGQDIARSGSRSGESARDAELLHA